MTASYYYYLNGVYQYPVSHSHACTLIGVHLPVDDVAGTTYERGEFMFVRGADTPAEGNEDVGVGYDCDGRPIGG